MNTIHARKNPGQPPHRFLFRRVPEAGTAELNAMLSQPLNRRVQKFCLLSPVPPCSSNVTRRCSYNTGRTAVLVRLYHPKRSNVERNPLRHARQLPERDA